MNEQIATSEADILDSLPAPVPKLAAGVRVPDVRRAEDGVLGCLFEALFVLIGLLATVGLAALSTL